MMSSPKKASKQKTLPRSKTLVSTKPRKRTAEMAGDVEKLMHLLELNQIELEHQNQELRITEQELEVSRIKYVNLFDFSPIPYFVLDMDGVVQEVNLCASKMFGIDRNKLVGRRFAAYIQQGDKDTFYAFMKAVSTSSTRQSCKLTIINKDKLDFRVQLEGMRLDSNLQSATECQIALIDFTKYQKAEAESTSDKG
jgi:PAS domain S-box-containing protein